MSDLLYCYRAFGLNITTNVAIPYLVRATALQPDWYLHCCEPATLAAMPATAVQTSAISWQWQTADQHWLRFIDPYNQGMAEFCLSPAAKTMTVSRTASVQLEDVIKLCTSTMYGALLRASDKLVLHATAVRFGDGCLLLSAQSGAGKSSATAALIQAGWPLLADDIASLRQTASGWLVEHGYPHLRLWPDSISALLSGSEHTQQVFLRAEIVGNKQYWDLSQQPELFCPAPLPLRAIYLLSGRNNIDHQVALVPPVRALPMLLQHLYAGQMRQPQQVAAAFPVLSQLVNTVPVYALGLADGLQQLKGLAAFLQHHLATEG